MGLDMYLYATKYLSRYTNPEDLDIVLHDLGATTWVEKGLPSVEVKVKVAYWRKANQIHAWFVENVQNGADDCGDYGVSREQLQELLALCHQVIDGSEVVEGRVYMGSQYTPGKGEEQIYETGQVLKDSAIAEELLPATSGFFFGGTDYDHFYLANLGDTVEQLTRVLAEVPAEWDFEYHSSW